jgi:uncharacterized protein (TIGR03437 family)
VALLLSNSPWADAFLALWEIPVGLQIGSGEAVRSLKEWINDGVMTLFFFLVLVALELKREIMLGELGQPRVAALSIAVRAVGSSGLGHSHGDRYGVRDRVPRAPGVAHSVQPPRVHAVAGHHLTSARFVVAIGYSSHVAWAPLALAGATVTIDAVGASVTVVTSTMITAIVPAHTAGPADVVVTNPGGSMGMLTAAFTYSFEEPFTVTPSTDTVDAGGQLSVSWTAPAARAGDWLALFRVGPNYEDDWWGDTKGATSGTLTVNAPTRPWQYEFRYLLDEGVIDVARSSPLTVR